MASAQLAASAAKRASTMPIRATVIGATVV